MGSETTFKVWYVKHLPPVSPLELPLDSKMTDVRQCGTPSCATSALSRPASKHPSQLASQPASELSHASASRCVRNRGKQEVPEPKNGDPVWAQTQSQELPRRAWPQAMPVPNVAFETVENKRFPTPMGPRLGPNACTGAAEHKPWQCLTLRSKP